MKYNHAHVNEIGVVVDVITFLINMLGCSGFADMVLYIEACEAGSMFEGMIDDSLDIYATTAANAHESSWATYCPGMQPAPPAEFTTCLGDLYSVSWMENRCCCIQSLHIPSLHEMQQPKA